MPGALFAMGSHFVLPGPTAMTDTSIHQKHHEFIPWRLPKLPNRQVLNNKAEEKTPLNFDGSLKPCLKTPAS